MKAARWCGKAIKVMGGCLGGLALALTLVIVPASVQGAPSIGRYQVVDGGDNGYLVDTQTGAVWALTHRALPTGREPVAIPYKFLKISPKDSVDFLIETQEPSPSKSK